MFGIGEWCSPIPEHGFCKTDECIDFECPDGFKKILEGANEGDILDHSTRGYAYDCEDINECEDGTSDELKEKGTWKDKNCDPGSCCHEKATCTNSIGSGIHRRPGYSPATPDYLQLPPTAPGYSPGRATNLEDPESVNNP